MRHYCIAVASPRMREEHGITTRMISTGETANPAAHAKYPFDLMQIGYSFLLAYQTADECRKIKRAAVGASLRHGKKFVFLVRPHTKTIEVMRAA